jgi:molybdopterin-binding protein
MSFLPIFAILIGATLISVSVLASEDELELGEQSQAIAAIKGEQAISEEEVGDLVLIS